MGGSSEPPEPPIATPLQDGMRAVFQEVNELIDEKNMKVGGKNINLEFFPLWRHENQAKTVGPSRCHGHICMRPLQNFKRGQAHCGQHLSAL